MKTIVIMNEKHNILPEQAEILDSRFKRWETLKVPSTGWTLEEIKKIIETYVPSRAHVNVIFVSPIPAMIKMLSRVRKTVYVFHNDHREKVELPNGKIIQKVAKTGWVLV